MVPIKKPCGSSRERGDSIKQTVQLGQRSVALGGVHLMPSLEAGTISENQRLCRLNPVSEILRKPDARQPGIDERMGHHKKFPNDEDLNMAESAPDIQIESPIVHYGHRDRLPQTRYDNSHPDKVNLIAKDNLWQT